jgi:hypothetical protein
MPGTGNGRTSPIIADDAMSADINHEYMLESEDGSPLPYLDFDTTSDTLQFLDSNRPTDTKALFTSGGDLNGSTQSGMSPNSLIGSQDSLSDSSSSKRTESSASTKSTFTGGDVLMTDVTVAKQEWRFEDFVHGEEDMPFNHGDGTINPSTIDNSFSFTSLQPPSHVSDLASPSDSPSPFGTTAEGLSPDTGDAPGNGLPISTTVAPADSNNKSNTVSFFLNFERLRPTCLAGATTLLLRIY